VGLDQPTAAGTGGVELDQFAVGTGIQVSTQMSLRHRVERLGDLHVEVAVDLDSGEDRLVVAGRDR